MRALGAGSICAVDMNQQRLDAARVSGADEVKLAGQDLPSADRVVVCTGAASAARQALDSVNRGGQVMFFAANGPEEKLEIPLTRFWTSQPSVLFSYGAAPRDMSEALELIASGKVPVDDLVTHRFWRRRGYVRRVRQTRPGSCLHGAQGGRRSTPNLGTHPAGFTLPPSQRLAAQ
jgi:L-iditol 2-dehydrogenase